MSRASKVPLSRAAYDPNQVLLQCATCGRKFNEEALQRHAPICQRIFYKKRPVFDSAKQRRIVLTSPIRIAKTSSKAVRKSNWRQIHNDFINGIRSAKEATQAMREGRPLPPPPPASINPGFE